MKPGARPDCVPKPAQAPARRGRRTAAPAQAEMPFAIVEGQPITEMPRDLYIPPQALEVFLEAFEGPLDMLLYLIRRQNLDILDIPIAEITRQYMRYIELMQVLQLELAGEYLLMAATLAEVKSRMLLPRPHTDETPRKRIRAPSWCAGCRSTSASSGRPRASTASRALERDTWVGVRRARRPQSGAHCRRRSRCRRCCSRSRTCWRAATCSRIITCSANRCRCASA